MKNPWTSSIAGVLRQRPTAAVRRITRRLTRHAVPIGALPLAAFLVTSGAPDARISRRTVPPSSGTVGLPDLVPVTDSGRYLRLQERTEMRYAFWARNAGEAPSKESLIQLRVSYRPWVQCATSQCDTPWKMHADVTLKIPPLKPGEESKALVSRILEQGGGVWDSRSYKHYPRMTLPPQGNWELKWEFYVDAAGQNAEGNTTNTATANNSMVRQERMPLSRNFKFETGPSGKFH